MSNQPDATVKVVVVGDSGVGKSTLLKSFTTGTFVPHIAPTIGIEFEVKAVTVLDRQDGATKTVNLQLWDTAGQERFRVMPRSYFRGADAAVLVYDCGERNSFDSIQRWLEEIRSYTDADERSLSLLLIGNKTDLYEGQSPENMAVPKSEAQQFAQSHNMLFALTSAKTLEGVGEAFDEVTRVAYDAIQQEKYNHRKGGKGTNLNSGGGGGGGGGKCC